MDNRLKTAFHETFSVSRHAVSQVLSVYANSNKDVQLAIRQQKMNVLRELTTLGTNQVKAMPRYAFGAGLVHEGKELTTFGQFVYRYDPSLGHLEAQWLMHYHLSAPHGPGPSFWSELVTTRFHPGHSFTRNELRAQIGTIVERDDGKKLAEKTINGAATAFLGTYTKSEGLGALGLLEKTGKDEYRVGEPSPPNPWVVAVALSNYWNAHFAGRLTVNLNELSQGSHIPNLFLLNDDAWDSTLRTLQREHFIDLHRTAPPYQIVLLQQDKAFPLEKLYGTISPEGSN